MDFWRSIGGMVEVSVTSASNESLLRDINRAGIEVDNMIPGNDELTISFQIRRTDLSRIKAIASRRGADLKVHKRIGLYWAVVGLLKRPALVAGMLFLLLAVTILPTRIFFFRVEGNENIPTNIILEKCESFGLSFGASRVHVRSEKVKNALLEAIPELKWAGINTSGCVATISVQERTETENILQTNGVSKIIATKDGVVTECTVTKGNAVCKPGQAVRQGQTLISGYTDCGISIRAEQAEGEVYAQTEVKLEAVFPDIACKKANATEQIKKYSLIIGKKRINLYKDSGISDTRCDKMYLEKYLTLPGGFQLPVAIVTEIWNEYTCEDIGVEAAEAESILTEFSKEYVSSHMIAGKILDSDTVISAGDGFYSLSGYYICNEMIGLTQNEEIIKPYGKHD